MSDVPSKRFAADTVDALDLDSLRPTFGRMMRIAQDLFDCLSVDVVILRERGAWRASDPEGRFDREAPAAAQVIAAGDIVWTADTTADPWWKDHRWVTGKRGLRFIAGAPITLHTGEIIGALVIADGRPRHRDPRLAERLVDLAGAVAQDCDRALALAARDRSDRRLRLATKLAGLHVWELDYVTGAMESDGREHRFYDGPITAENRRSDDLPLIHPDDRERVRELWRLQREARKPGAVEFRINRLDGRELWVSSTMELLVDDEGNPKRLTSAMHDVTQRRHAEDAMAKALAIAESANRTKTEFLANISHELRTPLNGVIGLSSVLARTDLTEVQRDLLNTIESSASALQAMVTDLLDLSRIESGRIEMKQTSFSPSDLVADCVAIFRATAAAKGLDLAVSVASEAQRAFIGDPVRIGQILSNLVSNALKFTSTGGVSVAIEADHAFDAARLTFSVTDTGIGFDDESAARIFDRFEQADASSTRQHGGAGLGLAICRSLADCMGGEISARSEVGRGSTFEFSVALPYGESKADDASDISDAEVSPAADTVARPPRVLVADDHPTNRRVVELILGSVGVELYSVENGAEALELAATQRFDLILMDVQMPVMDGLTAIRAIRDMEQRLGRPRTPIYTLTANALPEHAEQSMAAGADAHLTKPIAANGLIAAVERACLEFDDNTIPDSGRSAA